MHNITNFYQSFKNDSIPFGWEKAKKYVRQFLLLFFIGIAASGLASSFSPGENVHNAMSFFSDTLNALVSAIIAVTCIRIYLDIVAGKGVNFNYFKINTKQKRWLIGKWIWGYLLYTIIVILGVGVFAILWIWGYGIVKIIGWIGVLIFTILGIYLAIRLSFWQLFLIDKKNSIKDSLRASWEKTKGHEREIIGIGVLGFGIVLLGGLALIIGLLRAIPTVKIAFTHLYKKISD